MNPTEEPTTPSQSSAVTALIRRWARVSIVLLALTLVASRFSHLHRHLDMLSHVQMQYFIAAGALTVMLLLVRSWKWALFAAGVTALPAQALAPYYLPRSAPPIANAQPALRCMLFNVLQTNDRFEDVIAQVRAVDPDLVVFQEADARWFERLQPLRDILPHAHHEPGGILRGMAIFSRFPLLDLHHQDFNNALSPSPAFALEIQNQRVHVLAVHPWPPTSDFNFASRNEHLRQVGEYLGKQPGPTILLGDLNTALWSATHRDLERRSGLRNARQGFGVLPTHPTDRLFLLRVPIDHCLMSDEFAVLDCRVGDPCGSDHAPLVVDLVLAR